MKVLKFGGTSVGTPDSLRNVKNIVEKQREERLIVVVSALGGITDKLIATARTASSGSLEYIVTYAEIVSRHIDMIHKIVPAGRQEKVFAMVNPLLEELGNIYRGISLIRDLSQRTLDVVVSYGERMSASIVTNVINDSTLFDSRNFITTTTIHGKHLLDNETTDKKIHEAFDNADYSIAIVPGFISRDRDGDITNLGRGGSDFTAAILAAALDAQSLEIWTDVDGFMTADPRVVKKAKVIDSLSFSEAMELCNYGAKVIYPPTIYPVFRRNIPVVVKNTFNPQAIGTNIFGYSSNIDAEFPIKGISSISAVSLVNIIGTGVEYINQISQRIFEALSKGAIKPLLLSMAFSDQKIMIAVPSNDADTAVEMLSECFLPELKSGSISEISIIDGLSSIAVVGDSLSAAPGIIGRLSLALGDSNVSVVASTQGATENRSIFIVDEKNLTKALEILHTAAMLDNE